MTISVLFLLTLLKLAICVPDPNIKIGVDIQVDNEGNCGGGSCTKGCVFGDTTYVNKETLETCMELKCLDGLWNYKGRTNKVCGNCGFHGDYPSFITFDQHTQNGNTYGFNESGTYAITQNGLEDSQEFGINATFAMGGDPLVPYITSATYYEAGSVVDMILPARNLTAYCNDPSNDPANNPLCKIKVLVNGLLKTIDKTVTSYDATDGTVLVFEDHQIGDEFSYGDDDLLCINIVASKGFSVNLCQQFMPWGYAFLHIRVMPTLKDLPSKIYGLCDTFTGTTREYYTARNGSQETDIGIFVESWKIGEDLDLESVQPIQLLDDSSASCDCDYYWSGGCKIVTAAPVNNSCYCVFWGANHCSGQVHNYCANPGSKWCVTPDTSIQSCVQSSGGECDGYNNKCDCAHNGGNAWGNKGGCQIIAAAASDLACECFKVGGQLNHCSGDITYCTDANSDKCHTPDLTQDSCIQGRGNCNGY